MSKVTGFDFTVPETKYTFEELVEHLKDWCKCWVFQKEMGDSGYIHYQGRVRLIKARRFSTLKTTDFLKGGRFTPTTGEEFKKKSFAYVMKADTRVEGPWDDRDFLEPPKKTRQLEEFLNYEMYGWQKAILEKLPVYDDRHIWIILCKSGNNGKSIFSEYLEYKGLAYEIPPMRSMEDIMGVVMGIPDQKNFTIDMPRGMKKKDLAEFYAGVESIKDGKAYDKRYSWKKKRFSRPNVFVFTNTLPDFDLMSPDRWTVKEIVGTELVDWKPANVGTGFQKPF